MSGRAPPPGLTEADFDRIEAAVMETERGRWFLLEYARRVRTEAVSGVAEALSRLEEAMRRSGSSLAAGAGWGGRLAQIEERLLDLAWRLREEGADRAYAEVAAEIAAIRRLALPNFDAVQADRPAEVTPSDPGQGQLSQRLRALDRPLETHPTATPPSPVGELAGPGLQEHAPPMLPPQDRQRSAFAAIEALSPSERLAFFA